MSKDIIREVDRYCELIRVYGKDYKLQHKAPTSGSPIYDLTTGGIYPNDFYETMEYYYGGEPGLSEGVSIIRRVRGKAEDKIKVYRAVPEGIEVINDGDWVTTSRKYAEAHAINDYGEDMKVISKVVRAKELYNDGSSLMEYGYKIGG